MARKSRKKMNQIPETNMVMGLVAEEPENMLPTGAYIRLSIENSGHDTDDTVQSQIAMVHDYIRRQPDLKLADTYVDNGYTGTNFDRPEFERLMQDVRSWKIQCIVVKDLSRFGRDYLETGYYLETIFPKLNVRFIAINDDFDSTRPEDLEKLAVPIKNIVNNFYAREVSKKLVSVQELKRQRGDLPNGTPPYGYVHDEEKQTFVVNENTAGYVRAMFQWMRMGLTKAEIARRLDFLQAPVPRGKNHEAEGSGSTKWHVSSIGRLLQNPVFAGDFAYGKTKCALYKGIKTTNVGQDEWVIHRNRHEAVVLRSDFEEVQEQLRQSRAKHQKEHRSQAEKNTEPQNPFRGIIFCGCCRKHMSYAHWSYSGEKNPRGIFYCNSKKWENRCANHNVQENLVKIMVMDQIHLLIKAACDRKKTVMRLLEGSGKDGVWKSLDKKMDSTSNRIRQAGDRLDSLYMDYSDGVIDKEEYQYMKEHFIVEKQELEEKLADLSNKRSAIERKAKGCLEKAEHLEQYMDRRDFDAALVKEMVEAIYVGLDNTLEIRFRCTDVYQKLFDCLEAAENEE